MSKKRKITEKDVSIVYEQKKLESLQQRIEVAQQLIDMTNENGEPYFDVEYIKRVILK
jgi:hypothetical protein